MIVMSMVGSVEKGRQDVMNAYIRQRDVSGSLEDFNHRIAGYQDKAYTLAFYLFGKEAPAVEAVHNGFCRAYQDLQKAQRWTFEVWLLHQVISACQKKARSSEGNQYSQRTREVVNDLSLRLLRLPFEQRVAVVLIDLLGLKHQEAAQAAGCSPEVISKRLAQGRSYLSSANHIRNG